MRAKADLLVLLAFTDEANADPTGGAVLRGPGHSRRQSAASRRKCFRSENRSLIYYVTNEGARAGHPAARISRRRAAAVLGNEIRLLDQIPQDTTFRARPGLIATRCGAPSWRCDDARPVAGDMVPGVRTVATYVGSQRCLACHPTAGAVWAQSATRTPSRRSGAPRRMPTPSASAATRPALAPPSGYQREFGRTSSSMSAARAATGPAACMFRNARPRHRAWWRSDSSTVRWPRAIARNVTTANSAAPFDWDQFWPADQARQGTQGHRRKDAMKPEPAFLCRLTPRVASRFLSPHPCPLPWGEENRVQRGRSYTQQHLSKRRELPVPSPRGEGQGEGKGAGSSLRRTTQFTAGNWTAGFFAVLLFTALPALADIPAGWSTNLSDTLTSAATNDRPVLLTSPPRGAGRAN